MSQEMLIALGANQPSVVGPPAVTLKAALQRLEDLGAVILGQSRFFKTPAFPAGAGPDFANAAARLSWDVAPQEALTALHEIEQAFGRTRKERWTPRVLDIDLLAAEETILPDTLRQSYWRDLPVAQQLASVPDTLILPHPRLQERAFVLVPLAEIAPTWCHPILGLSVTEMLGRLDPDLLEEVIPLEIPT